MRFIFIAILIGAVVMSSIEQLVALQWIWSEPGPLVEFNAVDRLAYIVVLTAFVALGVAYHDVLGPSLLRKAAALLIVALAAFGAAIGGGVLNDLLMTQVTAPDGRSWSPCEEYTVGYGRSTRVRHIYTTSVSACETFKDAWAKSLHIETTLRETNLKYIP